VRGTIEERMLATRRQDDSFIDLLDDADALTVCAQGAVDQERGTHFSLDQLARLLGVMKE